MKMLSRFLLIPLLIASLCLTAGCGLLRRLRPPVPTTAPTVSTTADSTTIPQDTTDLPSNTETAVSETDTDGVPQVITYFELNDTYPIDDNFDAGFIVSLPKILSSKPGAVNINNEIDTLRIALVKEHSTAAPLSSYEQQFKYIYTTAVYKDIVFVSLNTSYGLWASEYITANRYYAYDYKTDSTLSDSQIAGLFGRDMGWVLTQVNSALAALGAEPVTGVDKIELFVNEDLKLVADAKIESVMGGDYSEILVLT